MAHVLTGSRARIQIAQYGAWCVEFLKHFTDLSWLILSCFFRLFLVTFLLCWTATAGSDSRDSTEGRDDMQQRSRGGDMSHTSTNCQRPFSCLFLCLNLQTYICSVILFKLCIQLDLHFLLCKPIAFSNLEITLPFTKAEYSGYYRLEL